MYEQPNLVKDQTFKYSRDIYFGYQNKRITTSFACFSFFELYDFMITQRPFYYLFQKPIYFTMNQMFPSVLIIWN